MADYDADSGMHPSRLQRLNEDTIEEDVEESPQHILETRHQSRSTPVLQIRGTALSRREDYGSAEGERGTSLKKKSGYQGTAYGRRENKDTISDIVQDDSQRGQDGRLSFYHHHDSNPRWNGRPNEKTDRKRHDSEVRQRPDLFDDLLSKRNMSRINQRIEDGRETRRSGHKVGTTRIERDDVQSGGQRVHHGHASSRDVFGRVEELGYRKRSPRHWNYHNDRPRSRSCSPAPELHRSRKHTFDSHSSAQYDRHDNCRHARHKQPQYGSHSLSTWLWKEHLSPEQNFERAWDQVPQEYRVLLRDTVTPSYRIQNDEMWRPDYSPLENAEHFIQLIPEKYRVRFGEFLAILDDNDEHGRR